MGADQDFPLGRRAGPHGGHHGRMQPFGAVLVGREPGRVGALGDGRRVFEDVAEHLGEERPAHPSRPVAAGRGMVAHPVTGDVEPRRHPHVAVTPHVVEEPLQRRRPPRPAGQAAVQPDRQHAPAPLRTLAVEDIKAVLEVLEEMLARVEALRGGEAHVVDVEGVGHDQLLAAANKLPVGQLVRIGVGKIQEPAFGRPDRERVGRGTSLVEPERPGAGDRRVKSDRLVDVGSLLLERVVPVVDPTQAVAGDLPARLVHSRDRLGVSARWRRRRPLPAGPGP